MEEKKTLTEIYEFIKERAEEEHCKTEQKEEIEKIKKELDKYSKKKGKKFTLTASFLNAYLG